jgi:hypothetical protein
MQNQKQTPSELTQHQDGVLALQHQIATIDPLKVGHCARYNPCDQLAKVLYHLLIYLKCYHRLKQQSNNPAMPLKVANATKSSQSPIKPCTCPSDNMALWSAQCNILLQVWRAPVKHKRPLKKTILNYATTEARQDIGNAK